MWFQLYGFVNLQPYITREFILALLKDPWAGLLTQILANTSILSVLWIYCYFGGFAKKLDDCKSCEDE